MNMKKYANVAISLAVLVLFLVFVGSVGTYMGPHGLFTAKSSRQTAVFKDKEGLILENAVLQKLGDQWISARFHLSNNSVQTISSVIVTCTFADESGRYVDTDSWLIHEKLLPETNISVELRDRKFLHTRSASQSCAITSYTPQSQPLIAFNEHDAAGGAHGDSDPHDAH